MKNDEENLLSKHMYDEQLYNDGIDIITLRYTLLYVKNRRFFLDRNEILDGLIITFDRVN